MPGLLRRACAVGVAVQLVFFAMFFGPLLGAASAAGTILTTSPIAVDLSGNPGTTTSTTLQVQNNSPKAQAISVKLDKFAVKGDSGQAGIYTPAASDVSTSWVHFSQTEFVAQPGVWNSVKMTIDVPSYAALGYYYAVLFVPNVNASTAHTNTVKGANAVLVLLDTHSKNEQRQLQVKTFAAQQGLYEFLPVTFNVVVKNSGNIHLIPEGDIYISRTENGKTIDSLDINPGQGNILPDSERQFQAQWTDGFPAFQTKRINGQIVSDRQGRPVQQLQWNFSSSFSKIRFGKYYAHLALVYNNGTEDVPINGNVAFWVIPWKLILLVIACLTAVVLLWKSLKKLVKQLWKKVVTK
jgi:hypothetical protein